jgi:DNA-3-methyladenine glycosylase
VDDGESSLNVDPPLSGLVELPVLEAAPALLGRCLETTIDGTVTAVILNEVEAYDGVGDPASHAYDGRRVPSNETLYAGPGTLYVYRSYGLHWCANVVTRGEGAAVLLRGGIPFAGTETMVSRRGRDDHLSDGPGKLAQALGITGDHDGLRFDEGPVSIGDVVVQRGVIRTTPRIGITRAADLPWRFVLVPVGG